MGSPRQRTAASLSRKHLHYLAVCLLAIALSWRFNSNRAQLDRLPSNIIATLDSEFCRRLQVFDHLELRVRFLRCDDVILGGIHFDSGESAFRAFIIMGAIQYLPLPDKRSGGIRRALCIGLGVGSVQRMLQQNHIIVDTVEIDPSVRDAALNHFNFSPNGEIFIEDALVWMKGGGRGKLYDYVAHDIFTYDSETMTNLYTQDAFEMMKNLMTPGGVVVINFVGFTSGKGSEMSAFIKKTLLNVFHNVACYSDGDPNELSANAVNLMFFCSDESDMSFRVPTMRAIEAETPDWILDQFQTWRVHSFSSETTAPTKTTSNWTPTLKLIRQDISDQVQGYLPHDSWSS